MSYSFIEPKLKPILSTFSKIWIFLILFFILLFIGINAFIKISTYTLVNQNEVKETKYNEIFIHINDTKQKIKDISTQRDSILDIYSSNNILKKSLHNLFDLVPDSVTLRDVYLDRNLLVIKGITPSKDTYKLLMEAPLKSIFNTSYTTFYQLKNGWLNFISTNKIDNPEGFNE